MKAPYNVIQDIPKATEANPTHYSVILGDIGAGGYPIGKFHVVAKGLDIYEARATKNKLNNAME